MIVIQGKEEIPEWGESRNRSVVKSTGCSFKGPGFGYQHPHLVHKHLYLLFQGIWCPLLVSMSTAHTWCTGLYADKYIKNSKKWLRSCDLKQAISEQRSMDGWDWPRNLRPFLESGRVRQQLESTLRNEGASTVNQIVLVGDQPCFKIRPHQGI